MQKYAKYYEINGKVLEAGVYQATNGKIPGKFLDTTGKEMRRYWESE